MAPSAWSRGGRGSGRRAGRLLPGRDGRKGDAYTVRIVLCRVVPCGGVPYAVLHRAGMPFVPYRYGAVPYLVSCCTVCSTVPCCTVCCAVVYRAVSFRALQYRAVYRIELYLCRVLPWGVVPYAVLYRTVLYCIYHVPFAVLYRTVLYLPCSVPCWTVPFCTVYYGTAP